ncbi:MAG: alcohol dehydrogenase catalytic domain-containing protein [Spirochaetota bacterium]
MKAAVLLAPEKIEIQEVPTPAIKPGEVLVKLKNCGICTLEQRLYAGAMKIFYPIIPGHEAAGEVVEVGADVLSGITPGTRVAMDLVVRCDECYFCRTGQSNLCANRFKNNKKVLGGFGEYMAVSASQVYPIPASLSYAEAAFAEPLSCCIRSLKKVGLKLAEDLLIIGAGPMGQMHLQIAQLMGARVFVSDPDKARLAMAKKLGAFLTIDPSSEDLVKILKEHTDGRGVDACVITSMAPVALTTAFEVVNKGGRVNIYTSYTDKPPLPIDANTLHRNEVTVTGTEGRTESDFLAAVRLLSFGKVDVKPLISRIVGYPSLEAGIKAAMTADTYRVLLEQEGTA